MLQLLTIAGSDSGGGAGIQADLKTWSALGAYGMSAISAVTAQNTTGVQAIHPIPPEILKAQIDSVFSDIRVDGVKIGMVGSADHIDAVRLCLERWRPAIIVLDPVMVAKSGHHLLEPQAMKALIDGLFPLADLLTPNIPEAEALLGRSIESLADMESAGAALRGLGAKAVLVKGGHRRSDATDVLVWQGGVQHFPGVLMNAKHTHGTGCSLSSALTVFIAGGNALPEAVARAKSYVAQGIAHGLNIGHGHGPIHHFYALWGKESL